VRRSGATAQIPLGVDGVRGEAEAIVDDLESFGPHLRHPRERQSRDDPVSEPGERARLVLVDLLEHDRQLRLVEPSAQGPE
jgi:hypothetical protein